jgi:aspartyl-tRNA synthetase
MTAPAERTHTCGELRPHHDGQSVLLQGWVHSARDKGGVIFLVLRDRSGMVQVTIDDRCAEAAWEGARQARLEFVLEVEGTVVLRGDGARNDEMATGGVEVLAAAVRVLNRTTPLPFAIGGQAVEASEEVRLKHRYLDLRRPELQDKLITRHKTALSVRRFLDAQGFLEVETPILNRSTPEGARDYLVPSRVHPGDWYALPQSPQIFKQLLMVSGFDRYFQIVKCFRDEDLRADRQPEFTQIDMEMSFVTSARVIALCTALIRHVWAEVLGVEVGEIPTLSYAEAMARFGVDNPDLRFGLEHQELAWAGTGFTVVADALAAGGICKAMVVPGAAESASRKTLDGWTDFVKRYKLGGLLWGKVKGDPRDDASWSGPLSKVEAPLRAQLAGVQSGDLVLVGAGKAAAVHAGLGRLRAHVARELDLIPAGRFAFCWVVGFPAFERDEEEGRWVAVHHPFTKPYDEHLALLGTGREGEILSDAYDIVCNGYEIGGGSIRIHDSEVQSRVFAALGLSVEEARHKFGFLIDALACGAPPHGGLAMGFDRWIMLLSGTENIRDVIAFPKTAAAQDLMAGAPNKVDPKQLAELSVKNTV